MKKLYLFTTPSCSGCKIVEKRLKEAKLKFDKVDCTDDSQYTVDLIARCDVKSSVPVTAIHDGKVLRFWEVGTNIDTTEIGAIMSGAR